MARENRGVETEDVAGPAFTIDPGDIDPSILRPVLDYWEHRRGAQPMPARLVID